MSKRCENEQRVRFALYVINGCLQSGSPTGFVSPAPKTPVSSAIKENLIERIISFKLFSASF